MSAPFNTPDAVWPLRPDVKVIGPQDVIPDALIIRVTSKAGNVEGDAPAVRVPYVSTEDAAGFVPEGDSIPESTPSDREVLIHTGKVASFFNLSREQYGQPDAASLLSDAVKRDLVRKANYAFLAQDAPVAPAVTPPAGILAQGITSLPGSIEESGNLDPVADAIAAVEVDGGVATHIVAHPYAWSMLTKLKVGVDFNQSLLGAGAEQAGRQLLSLPVLVDRDAPAGQLIVLDSRAILSVYGGIELATSTDYQFQKDVVSVRATWRFGAAVAHANRVVAVAVSAES